jgi:hypothetical protein
MQCWTVLCKNSLEMWYNFTMNNNFLSSLSRNDLTDSNSMNSLKFQLSVSYNMIIAVAAAFGMGYYVSKRLNYSSSQVCFEDDLKDRVYPFSLLKFIDI